MVLVLIFWDFTCRAAGELTLVRWQSIRTLIEVAQLGIVHDLDPLDECIEPNAILPNLLHVDYRLQLTFLRRELVDLLEAAAHLHVLEAVLEA